MPFGLSLPRAPFVPVVRLTGAIGAGGRFRQGFDFEAVVGAIEKAFALKQARAVAFIVNSPGGSPVQSSLIYKRIRALKTEKGKRVFVFVEDVAASGGYYIACAGDEIFVDESSIVGSIGVISAGFGFQDAIAKLGVERRVHTAGENKMMLDPFQAEREEDVNRLLAIQAEVHETFKRVVRAARGNRLKDEDPDLFTGAIWAGQKAVDVGLADGVGDIRSVLRGRYGEKLKLKVIPTRPTGWLARRLGMAGREGLAGETLSALEARAHWARFGL